MERYVTATEANQRFDELLRDVQSGESFVVTSQGRAVAKVVPIEDDQNKRRRRLRDFLEWARSQPIREVGNWKREDLYD